MKVSWDYDSQHMEKNMFQTTNQLCLLKPINYIYVPASWPVFFHCEKNRVKNLAENSTKKK